MRASLNESTLPLEESDAKWSCYKNFFNVGLGWSYDKDLIDSYFAEFERLKAHWLKHLGDKAISINYEKLVTSPNNELQKLCEGLDVSFEDNMLAFYKTSEAVQTASFRQVRNPLNTASIGQGRF